MNGHSHSLLLLEVNEIVNALAVPIEEYNHESRMDFELKLQGSCNVDVNLTAMQSATAYGSWLMAHGSVAHVAQSLALAVPVCGIHESIVILEAQLVLTFVHPPPIGERNRTQLVLTLDRISEPLRQIRPFRLLSASILPSKHTSKTSSHFRRAFPASSTLKHHRRLCEQPSSYASQ